MSEEQTVQEPVSPTSEAEEDAFEDHGSVNREPEAAEAPAGEQPATPQEPEEDNQDGQQTPAEPDPGAQEPDKTVPYKRFSKIYGHAKHLERENAQLKAQLGGQPPQGHQQQEQRQPQQPTQPEPQEDQFESYADYVKALAAWQTQQGIAQFQEQTATERQQRESQDLRRTFDQRLADGAAKIKGYDEVEPFIPNGLEEHVLHAENPAALAHYWGQHPEEALALLDLPPGLAAQEIGKLQVRLSTPATPAPRTEQTAFPPVKTVGGQETSPGKKIEDMSMEEYARHMNKKDGINY